MKYLIFTDIRDIEYLSNCAVEESLKFAIEESVKFLSEFNGYDNIKEYINDGYKPEDNLYIYKLVEDEDGIPIKKIIKKTLNNLVIKDKEEENEEYKLYLKLKAKFENKLL